MNTAGKVEQVFNSTDIFISFMSNKTDKIRKMKKNVLGRYEWDQVKGNMIINGFMQVSKLEEQLRNSDEKAYTVFMALLKENIELQEENIERGKRLGRLNKQEAALRKADRKGRITFLSSAPPRN